MNNLLKRCLQLRRLLRKSLEDKYPTYMSSVRDWVRKRKTRAELDLEAEARAKNLDARRRLKDGHHGEVEGLVQPFRFDKLPIEQGDRAILFSDHLLLTQVSSYLQQPVQKVHSEFLLTVSKLCCGRLSLRLDVPRAQPAASPGDLVDLCNDSRAGQLVVDLSSDSGAGQPDPFLLYKRVYTDREICGVELIKARFYLAAWDRELYGIDSKISRVLYCAMRNYIKDIIHAAILHRGMKKSNSDRISGLDIWHGVVRTNCDLPAVLCGSDLPTHFRNQNQGNGTV